MVGPPALTRLAKGLSRLGFRSRNSIDHSSMVSYHDEAFNLRKEKKIEFPTAWYRYEQIHKATNKQVSGLVRRAQNGLQ